MMFRSIGVILLHLHNICAYTVTNDILGPAGLDMRQGSAQLCGIQNGRTTCPEDSCCSEDGHCGKGRAFCDSPQCQFRYGPACDANKVPSGANTSTVPRPPFGNVAYGGAGIRNCTVPGTVALTFDDGPYLYTSDLLDELKRKNVTATFFLTSVSRGKDEFDNQSTPFADIVRRMHADGHQLGSHTWSHADLTNLTQDERRQEIVKNEMAFQNLFGFFPTYLRPPFGDCTQKSNCTNEMADLGYHIIYWSVDTEDFRNSSPELIHNPENLVNKSLSSCDPSTCSHIIYSHDTDREVVNLTSSMIDDIQRKGYKAVTIGECLSDPAGYWYRNATTGNPVASGSL